MKKVVLGSILALLVGCASVQPNDPVAINDALVGFTVNSQGKHWPEALSFVTPDEAEEITDENGLMKEEYRLAASRLRISALKQMPWRVDGRGRLIGIKDVLDDFNKKYIVSEDEKKVGTNLEQMRQERINRTLEKGKRIMAGEDEQKEPEVEVYTNKLTEEEKRKYGSTAELRPPEEEYDGESSTTETSSTENFSSESSDEPSQVFEPETSNVEEDGYYGPEDDASGATSDF